VRLAFNAALDNDPTGVLLFFKTLWGEET